MKRLMSALRKAARERGESWHERFVSHLYSGDWREEAAFFKMLTDKLFVKTSDSEINVNQRHVGPTIYLPEEVPEGQPWTPTNYPGKGEDVH